MAGLVRLLVQKWSPPALTTTSFDGKTIIITGANTGIGFEAALRFVELGASKVIFGVRTIKKGEDAKAAIEQRTGKKDRIEVWPIDMGSYPSIKSFAEKASQLPQLDIAILNAGIHNASYKTSDYGFEEDLQINALSTAYLGLLLLPKLKASKTSTHTPVLEIVTSGVHKTVELKDEQKQAENLLQSFNDSSTSFNARKNYAISKLLAMYVMQSLGKLAESSTGELDVIVNSACPGATKSDLARDFSPAMQVAAAILFALFFRTTENGSRSIVSGVTLGKQSHGGFWQHDTLQEPVPLVSGEEGERLRAQLWHEIIDALRKDVPEVLELTQARS